MLPCTQGKGWFWCGTWPSTALMLRHLWVRGFRGAWTQLQSLLILGSYCLKVTRVVKVNQETRITGSMVLKLVPLCVVWRDHTLVQCIHAWALHVYINPCYTIIGVFIPLMYMSAVWPIDNFISIKVMMTFPLWAVHSDHWDAEL